MKKPTLVLWTLVLALMLSILPAAGVLAEAGFTAEDHDNVTAPGEFPIVKEPITLTVTVPLATQVEDYETNEFTKWLEEKSGINLEFNTLPSGDDGLTKLKVALATGSGYGDVILGFWMSDLDVYKYGSQGFIRDLNEYYDVYGYYTLQGFEKHPEVRAMATSPDGSLYVVPRYVRSIGNELPQRVWINKLWLDNLGLDIPTTTEEFEAVLRAFLNDDPNQNGQQDEIPYAGAITGWASQPENFLLNAFLYNDAGNRFIVEDGKVDVAYTQDAWREALTYMNRLCADRLLSPLSYTQDEAQLKQIVATPGESVLGVIPAGSLGNIFAANDERIEEYVPLPPLKGPEGVQYTSYEPSGTNNTFMISKDCKNPAAAFRLADLFYSEEAVLRGRFGVPEVDWVEPEEGETSLYADMGYPALIKPILPWGGTQNSHWSEIQSTFRDAEVTHGQVWNGTIDFNYLIAQAVPEYLSYIPDEYLWKRVFTEEEAEEVGELDVNLRNYVKESIARFITGDLSIETGWDSYLKELSTIGVDRYVEINQAVYDRMNNNE